MEIDFSTFRDEDIGHWVAVVEIPVGASKAYAAMVCPTEGHASYATEMAACAARAAPENRFLNVRQYVGEITRERIQAGTVQL